MSVEIPSFLPFAWFFIDGIYLFKPKKLQSDLTWPTVWENSGTTLILQGLWSSGTILHFCHVSVEWCPPKALVSGVFLLSQHLSWSPFPSLLLLTSFSFSSCWPINKWINWFTAQAYLEHCLCIEGCSRLWKHISAQFLPLSSSQTAVETDIQSNIAQHD